MMRIFKLMLAGLLLSLPALAMADVSQVPGSATWYLHVDLHQMKTAEAGQAVYRWMEDEIFDEVKEEAGVDFGKELDRLTA